MSEDDSQYNQMLGDEISAILMLDPSTRMWRLELQGPAAMLLFFLLDPSEEDSTELGEGPHADKKGSADPRMRPYGYQYMYSLLREREDK